MDFVIFAKSIPIKAFTRTRKGKIEQVHQFERRGDKAIVKSQSKQIVDGLDNVMKLFKQTEGMCGPASIRIAISTFHKSYSERDIALIASSTVKEGTHSAGMIKALKKIGISTIEFKNMSKTHSIEVVKNFTAQGKPVIASWLKTKVGKGKEEVLDTRTIKSTDEYEHYSVLSKIDDKLVYMFDPMEKTEQKLPIKYFIDRWWDRVDKRWFLVLDGEKK
jgi:ABC-type bacteriocin/lantibiotic exporter with double-glycine peptidase domain